jgi:hypothetical protein
MKIPRPLKREDGWPTRSDMQYWTGGEHLIMAAINAVELMGAHPALTEAVNLLIKAKERVADFAEGLDEPGRLVPPHGSGPAQYR